MGSTYQNLIFSTSSFVSLIHDHFWSFSCKPASSSYSTQSYILVPISVLYGNNNARKFLLLLLLTSLGFILKPGKRSIPYREPVCCVHNNTACRLSSFFTSIFLVSNSISDFIASIVGWLPFLEFLFSAMGPWQVHRSVSLLTVFSSIKIVE